MAYCTIGTVGRGANKFKRERESSADKGVNFLGVKMPSSSGGPSVPTTLVVKIVIAKKRINSAVISGCCERQSSWGFESQAEIGGGFPRNLGTLDTLGVRAWVTE